MASVRIIAVPPGEAPQKVREAWVGLELPLLQGWLGKNKDWRTVGVMTGPKTFFEKIKVLFSGKAVKRTGYAVLVGKAVEILARHDPAAAQWWRDNAPHLFKGTQVFIFPRKVCSEVQTKA